MYHGPQYLAVFNNRIVCMVNLSTQTMLSLNNSTMPEYINLPMKLVGMSEQEKSHFSYKIHLPEVLPTLPSVVPLLCRYWF